MRTRIVAGIATALLAAVGFGTAAPPPAAGLDAADCATAAHSTTSGAVPDTRPAAPVEDPYYPAKSNPEIDTRHDRLDLTWDGAVLTGHATIRFEVTRTTDRVRLDLIRALTVSRVTLDATAVGFRQVGPMGLIIHVGTQHPRVVHTLQIWYAGRPHPVHAPTHRGDLAEGLGWTLDTDGNVSTFQEPYGAYSWYPVNDHPSDKASYDARITVPKADTAVFNGVLTATSSTGTTRTYSWHEGDQVASYLITVAIGPYTAYHDTMRDGTPTTYWLLPRDAGILASLESQAREAFDWLEQRAGDYPFDRFGIVVTGGDSAMETQGLVTLSRTAFARPDAVVEHEMAHQWYGDTVTPLDWQGLWLSEGWAMWMQQAYEVDRGGYRYLGGIDHWRQYDDQARQRSGPPGDYDPRSFGDLNVYLGPAMMLDKIRQRVGDAEFTALSKAWVTEHADRNVTRAEFVQWLDARTGQRFDRLVDLWLDSEHTPRWP